MNNEQKAIELEEEYLKKYGWKKTKGYKINCEFAKDQGWEYFYFPLEDYKDYVTECEYWENDNYDECFDDIDDATERTEEDEDELLTDFIYEKTEGET